MTAEHVFFIPAVLIVGFVAGYLVGQQRSLDSWANQPGPPDSPTTNPNNTSKNHNNNSAEKGHDQQS